MVVPTYLPTVLVRRNAGGGGGGGGSGGGGGGGGVGFCFRTVFSLL